MYGLGERAYSVGGKLGFPEVRAGYQRGALMRARIAFSLVVALALVVGCSSDEGDSATAEQLIDEHNLAWVDNEPEGVGAVFTDGGVFVDLAGVEIVGKDEIVAYAKGHVGLVTESRRTGPITVNEEGVFLVSTELVVMGRGTYTGIVAVTIDDDLFARYEWHEGPTRQ